MAVATAHRGTKKVRATVWKCRFKPLSKAAREHIRAQYRDLDRMRDSDIPLGGTFVIGQKE